LTSSVSTVLDHSTKDISIYIPESDKGEVNFRAINVKRDVIDFRAMSVYRGDVLDMLEGLCRLGGLSGLTLDNSTR
jgi:ferredoxin-fold anticodon binding domain-containing protein